MNEHYYSPSGRVPPAAVPIVMLHAVATVPVAWLFAWPAAYAPLIVRPFFSILFAALLASLAHSAVGRAKIRHPGWAARFGVGVCLAGWYAHWIFVLGRVAHIDAAVLVLHPGAMWTALAAHARDSGLALVACWPLEGWLFVALARRSARKQAEAPFCEASNRWMKGIDVDAKFAWLDEAKAAAPFLEAYPHLAPLMLAPLRPDGAPGAAAATHHARVTIHRCDGAASYLSIHNVQVERGKAGKENEARGLESPVVAYLRLPGVDPDALLRELNPAAAPAADGANGAPDRPTPPELVAGIEHLENQRFDAALAAAAPHLDADEPGLRADALHLAALACSRLDRWPEALGYWQALFDLEPGALNALQIASSAVMAGDTARGAMWHARAKLLNGARPQVPTMSVLTNYLTALTMSGQMAAAMPCLEEVRSWYAKFGVTDPTALFMQRIPPFSSFLENSMPIVRANLDAAGGRAWYAALRPHLDEPGRDHLDGWLAQHFEAA